MLDLYCNACDARLTINALDTAESDDCPRCGSARTLLALHTGPYDTLDQASEAQFTAFIRRAAYGQVRVGSRPIGLAFELPWLQYENEVVRDALRTVAPELDISVPRRKPGETRGPGGDLLAIGYQNVYDIAEQIVVWAGIGAIVRKALQYLLTQSPEVLINEGVALSLGAAAIYDALDKVALDYAFVIASHQAAGLPIDVPEHAFVVGFESKKRIAWAIVSDVGAVLTLDHNPRSKEPAWWDQAKAIDKHLAATLFPRDYES